jgi:hypothetical protein
LHFIGAALDRDLKTAERHLVGLADFDEIVLGGGWGNAAVAQYLRATPELPMAVPTILLATRSTPDASLTGSGYGAPNELVRYSGSRNIIEWIKAGAPLPLADPPH